MKTKQIIGIVISGIVFIAVGAANVVSHSVADSILQESMKDMLSGDSTANQLPMEDYIAIVKVEGTIQEQIEDRFITSLDYQHDTTMEYINKLMKDPYNKAMLVYVDSPGGNVYESEELYNKISQYSETTGRPVWTYMAHYAASGGYMASVPADIIYANRNTTTGSIGVIMSGYDLNGLYEKLGIRYVSITSGDYKDGSLLTDEQIELYQEEVNEYYERFVQIVADNRPLSTEEVKKLADGRTYTASQALKNGLIDKISSYEDMKKEMSSELGLTRFYEPSAEKNMLSELFSMVQAAVPKSDNQVLMETAEKMESGVPMYYARQLR